ncbi:MAG: YchJ family metal-binding protein [Desulfuromonadales bacterium]|nr:YchJ family metal-binding protein [Desulfuromonadales bacterium]
MPDSSSPTQLILARVEAFRRCDFGFIFDTYHGDSNFRRQFPDREEYVRYGWANLGKEFRIHACTILREEIDGRVARVIFSLEFELHGTQQGYAELAWLEDDGEGWRYRCGQKLMPDEFPVPADRLDFRHFDEALNKVLY